MLLLDNIVFELQRAGGVSLVWRAIIDACIEDGTLDFQCLDSGNGTSNIFYPSALAKNKQIPDRGVLSLRRYSQVKTSPPPTVFHSSYFRTHSNKQTKNIVTVHDFVYEKFDSGLRKHVHLWQKKQALKKADVIICVSNNTKEDLLAYHPNLQEKVIKVIHNGVGTEFTPDPTPNDLTNHQPPYLLYVGGRFAHKNFNSALQLLNMPDAQRLNLQLFVVGGGELTVQENTLITELGLSSRIHHQGHVTNEQLNMLYRQAFAFIYPSLYEGFGIPPLEAMASGCPVICANISSIPEVVGNAGLLFDPKQIDAAEPYLEKLQHVDYREKIISNGLQRANEFSWQKTGQQTLNLYKELL